METFSRKTLSDTVETASEYSFKLNDLMKSVIGAQNQVKTTAEESNLEIDAAFDELTKCVLDALNKRRETLKEKVKKIEEEGIAPLNACYKMISETLKSTHTYICEGQDLLQQRDNVDLNLYVKYLEQSSLLGNLPAVPNLEEVPAITFQLNVSALCTSLANSITSAGRVSKMGPVQITHVLEKPGALLVHWEEVESERPLDVQNFCLELAIGSHPAANHRHTQAVYREVFVGQDTCFLVRDLQPKQCYTLRVCCKAEDGEWNAWSLPRVACTNQLPFGWQDGNAHYSISVGGKIACKNTTVKSVLMSNSAQFGPDHSIEFTILECGDVASSMDGLGLVDQNCDAIDSLCQKGVIFLSTAGVIFVDGKEKTTRLPPFKKSSCITFTCEPLTASRVRVHIDCGEKAVTYDWIVSTTNLRFAVLLSQPNWKVQPFFLMSLCIFHSYRALEFDTQRNMKTRHPFMNVKVEVPKDKLEDVRNIRNWLTHQHHLPELTDQHILLFLHSCYYSGEATKTTIDNYFTVRTQWADLFLDRSLDNTKKQLELFPMVPLPLATPDGDHLLLYRMGSTDPSVFNFVDALKAFLVFNDIRISEDGIVPGYRVLFDMKGYSLGHLARVTTCMQAVRKFMIYIQDCHPVRLKGIHVINTFSLIDTALNLVKPFMHSELLDILHLHNNVEGLSEYFPVDLMPKDYGGKLPQTTLEMHNKHMKSIFNKQYKTWLKDSETYVADLKKRPEKSKNQLLGIELEGSFKTLCID